MPEIKPSKCPNTNDPEELKEYFTRWIDTLSKLDIERDLRYEQRFEASEKARDNALIASDKARDSALTAMDKRLDTMNEFRNSLKDQAGTFLTRAEHEAYSKSVDGVIGGLRDWMNQQTGKATQGSVNIAMFFAVGGLALGVVSLIITILRSLP